MLISKRLLKFIRASQNNIFQLRWPSLNGRDTRSRAQEILYSSTHTTTGANQKPKIMRIEPRANNIFHIIKSLASNPGAKMKYYIILYGPGVLLSAVYYYYKTDGQRVYSVMRYIYNIPDSNP